MYLSKTLAFPTMGQLQEILIPSELTGEHGTNRSPKTLCQIKADNDLLAVMTWLDEYKEKPTTYRVYEKESQRFLLWCLYQHKKPLSSLRREDFEAYATFLSAPEPRAFWCGTKGGKGNYRGSKNWKPFIGGLTPKSINTAFIILNSMMTYLVDAGYLLQNPLKLMKRLKRKEVSLEERKLEVYEKVLTPDEWAVFINTLHHLPEDNEKLQHEKHQLTFIVYMLFFLGLRVSELTQSTWASFRKIQDHWWFLVKGKGDKLAKIPVHDELWKVILRYRVSLGLSPVPREDDFSPLIPSSHTDGNLSARHINNLLKSLATETAKSFEDNPKKASKLKKVSAHWLRHQSATMQTMAGINPLHVQQNLRHANRSTTEIYVHSFDAERINEMLKMNLINDF